MAERGGRGGRRAGRPGAKYPQRSDLALAPRTAPVVPIRGQGYGEQAAQLDGARAVNDAGRVAATRSVAPPPNPMQPPAAVPPSPPDIMGRLTAPTERPDEPFQAGLPSGPGPGPEVLGIGSSPSASLRSWLLEHPNDDDVRELIELLEIEGR